LKNSLHAIFLQSYPQKHDEPIFRKFIKPHHLVFPKNDLILFIPLNGAGIVFNEIFSSKKYHHFLVNNIILKISRKIIK